MEFYDNTGAAVAKLKWKTPGQTAYVRYRPRNLYPN
jgi:hypothetical protein